jgi:uncharacterized protein with ATP-grasp and redox domains
VNPFLDYECFECIAKLAFYIGKLSSSGVEDALRKSSALVEGFARAALESLDDYVELSARIAEHVATVAGDPYAGIRKRSMEVAKRLLPAAERYVEEGGDPLRRAASVAAAANALDFATGVYSASLEAFEREFEGRLREPFAIDHVAELEEALKGAGSALYVLDNAGECVFDLPLVKLLSERCSVTVAARGAPVFNDATIEEAREAGLDRYAELTTTGCRVPGVSASRCSPEFLKLLARSDVVVLKGQGNFQSFADVAKVRSKPAFYLLVPKCGPVARYLEVPVGAKVALKK